MVGVVLAYSLVDVVYCVLLSHRLKLRVLLLHFGKIHWHTTSGCISLIPDSGGFLAPTPIFALAFL